VSVKPHLVTHIECREGRSHASCLLFILASRDCKLVTNVSMDIAKVKCGLVSLCGGDHLNVNLDIGVKPLIRKEQGGVWGRVCSIVVCELCEREEKRPVIL
jgi:hypothetical protein